MTLILGHLTNNPAEAVVLMSELEAGGFNPIMFNYHHGLMAIGNIMALGGFRIMLHEEELPEARDFIKARTQNTDFDPIVERKFIDVVRATILSMNPLFPLYLVPPLFLFLLWIAYTIQWVIFTDYPVITGILEDSYLLCVISILAHTKYVALPRIRKSYEP